ncbi:hypothetical protein NC651_012074 [Populus alba x Populus x berolinensis]|nr:hypothetical protein NC651_012074 [Populus alba x Populus x berolinensis]
MTDQHDMIPSLPVMTVRLHTNQYGNGKKKPQNSSASHGIGEVIPVIFFWGVNMRVIN